MKVGSGVSLILPLSGDASPYQGAKSGGDYSVREISKGDNEQSGQYLLAFYAAWRLLDGDAFRVYPTPSVSPPAGLSAPLGS